MERFFSRFADFANDSSCIRDMTRKNQLKEMKTKLMEFSHIFSFLNFKKVLKHWMSAQIKDVQSRMMVRKKHPQSKWEKSAWINSCRANSVDGDYFKTREIRWITKLHEITACSIHFYSVARTKVSNRIDTFSDCSKIVLYKQNMHHIEWRIAAKSQNLIT